MPYPPSANVLWRTTKRGKTYLSPEAKQFKETVRILEAKQNVEQILGDVKITIDVYRPRRSGDLDNRIKAALDSVKEIAFEDDKFVIEIHARRFEDKAASRNFN